MRFIHTAAAMMAALFLAGALGLAGCAGPAAGDPKVAEPGRGGDFGIPDGRCNRRAIGAVLGGAIGGVLGSQIGEGRIAVLVGAAAGTLIGSEIGRRMDETDLACIGEGLEKAKDNQPVEWPSADRTATFRLVPLTSFSRDGRECRDFSLQAISRGRSQDSNSQACRGADGQWRLVNDRASRL
jgi:surface antigen